MCLRPPITTYQSLFPIPHFLFPNSRIPITYWQPGDPIHRLSFSYGFLKKGQGFLKVKTHPRIPANLHEFKKEFAPIRGD